MCVLCARVRVCVKLDTQKYVIRQLMDPLTGAAFRRVNKNRLKGHCIEFKYYADGKHSGLTPPGNNS